MASAHGIVIWYVKLVDEDGNTLSTNVFELGTVSEELAFKHACKISAIDVDDVSMDDCIFANSKDGDQAGATWVIILGDDDSGEIE